MKHIKTVIVFFLICIANTAFAGIGTDFHLNLRPKVVGNVYVSPVIKFEHPMDRAVLSWNVTTPNDSFVELLLRAKSDTLGWSNWFKMGVWGSGIKSHSVKGQDNRFGHVDIDTVELKNAATDWQYKIVLHRGSGKEVPSVNAAALTVKNSGSYKKSPSSDIVTANQLKVPSISQFEYADKAGQPDLGKRICSSTSVTMLLEFNGLKDLSPLDVAAKVYDSGADAYGNWPFNTAVMFDMLHSATPDISFTSYVRWFESFNSVVENINKGNPVIVSIGFKDGELTGAPKPTPGHLVLVRGADKKYVYVNDPAAPNKQTVARKYPKDEFIRAWKGVAYILDEGL